MVVIILSQILRACFVWSELEATGTLQQDEKNIKTKM